MSIAFGGLFEPPVHWFTGVLFFYLLLDKKSVRASATCYFTIFLYSNFDFLFVFLHTKVFFTFVWVWVYGLSNNKYSLFTVVLSIRLIVGPKCIVVSLELSHNFSVLELCNSFNSELKNPVTHVKFIIIDLRFRASKAM